MNWPYLVLNLQESANDEEIRSAYEQLVRLYPPEKDATRFSAIQQAYDLLKTPQRRTNLKLFGLQGSLTSLADLIPETILTRKKIPMEIWLKELNP